MRYVGLPGVWAVKQKVCAAYVNLLYDCWVFYKSRRAIKDCVYVMVIRNADQNLTLFPGIALFLILAFDDQ